MIRGRICRPSHLGDAHPACDLDNATVLSDYIEDLLLVIGRRDLGGRGMLRDADGHSRVIVPVRRWEQYLELGVTEIREYGATSVQVSRRLRAALEELLAEVPPQHRAAVEGDLCKLEATVAEHFEAVAERSLALASDRQGLGGPARPARPG